MYNSCNLTYSYIIILLAMKLEIMNMYHKHRQTVSVHQTDPITNRIPRNRAHNYLLAYKVRSALKALLGQWMNLNIVTSLHLRNLIFLVLKLNVPINIGIGLGFGLGIKINGRFHDVKKGLQFSYFRKQCPAAYQYQSK